MNNNEALSPFVVAGSPDDRGGKAISWSDKESAAQHSSAFEEQ